MQSAASTIQLDTCPPLIAPPPIAPKPPPVLVTSTPLRPPPPVISAAVRSSIRRFLAVSNPDNTNMLDVYRYLQREYGEDEVSKCKAGIRQYTKAVLDEMAAAQAVNGSPHSGLNGTVAVNGTASPQTPIVLPVTHASERQSAPPVLPSAPSPPPVSLAPPSSHSPPPLEAVPLYFPSPASSLPEALSPTLARSDSSPPKLPLANGHTLPLHHQSAREVRKQSHSNGAETGSVEENNVDDSEQQHDEHSEQSSDDEHSEEEAQSESESADEAEDEEREQQKKQKRSNGHSSRRSKKRKANKPLAVDTETGAETWEVRKIHRSDVNDRGEKVYKVSWYNWTAWPRHTWITRDEWMGGSRKLDEFEAEEREALEREQKRAAAGNGGHRHVKKRRLTGKKDHRGDITADTSWAFDEAKLREVEETQRRKRRREAKQSQKHKQKGKQSTKGKPTAAKKTTNTNHKMTVKTEESGDEVAQDEVQVIDMNDEERAEMLRAKAQKRREERKRVQEEEDSRIIPFVRADSRYLIPWSSDDDTEGEANVDQREAESESTKQRRRRRERRRLLRLFQLSTLLQQSSQSAAQPANSTSDVHTDGGLSDTTSGGEEEDREMREDAEVSVHESELTGESSEAEMDQWREERVYRVEAILDHRRMGRLSKREREEHEQTEAERKREKDEKAAARVGKRLNAFDRAQQRLEVGVAAVDKMKETNTQHKQKMKDEQESKEAVDDSTTVADSSSGGMNGEVEQDKAGDRRLEYLVHWSGHGDKYNTWEPEVNLKYGCKQLLRDYKLMAGLMEQKAAANKSTKNKKRGRRW